MTYHLYEFDRRPRIVFITLQEVDKVLSEACVGLIYDAYLSMDRIHWP